MQAEEGTGEMATYRNIQMSFWTDSKIADDFTPEDKYFFLYLLTNPHTNTCGCYELSTRQMAIDTGYTKETISKLLLRLQRVHKVIYYSEENKEILITNWSKYNWTSSDKLRVSILNCIKDIKTKEFKDFLLGCYENGDCEYGIDTLSKGYEYRIDTVSEQGEPFIDTGVGFVSDSPVKEKKPKPVKHEYGEYRHVKLSDAEYEKLARDYGEDALLEGIKRVDEYCQEHGKSYKDYNLTLRKWGITSEKISSAPVKTTGQVRRNLQ